MARLRGFVWLIAGIVLALLAGFIAYTSLSWVTELPAEKTGAEARTTVLAAARAVPMRSVLTLEDLQEIELPTAVVPEGAVRTTDAAVGRLTTQALFTGEPILDQRLIDPNVVSPDGRKALYLVDDQVLMAIPAQDLMSRSGLLQAGDRVDLLFSVEFPEDRGVGGGGGGGGGSDASTDQQTTFSLLQNVEIAGLVGGVQPATAEQATQEGDSSGTTKSTAGQPDAVLLTIPPQDALALKYAIDSGGTLDIVLRPPGVERPYEVDPVDVDYLINRYRIPTGPSR